MFVSNAVAHIPGDFNHDGAVDAADLAQWKGDFALNGDSDADNDGDSDGADFLAWQRQFRSGPGVVPALPCPRTSDVFAAHRGGGRNSPFRLSKASKTRQR